MKRNLCLERQRRIVAQVAPAVVREVAGRRVEAETRGAGGEAEVGAEDEKEEEDIEEAMLEAEVGAEDEKEEAMLEAEVGAEDEKEEATLEAEVEVDAGT